MPGPGPDKRRLKTVGDPTSNRQEGGKLRKPCEVRSEEKSDMKFRRRSFLLLLGKMRLAMFKKKPILVLMIIEK